MQIYFLAAISSADEMMQFYLKIIDTLELCGHDVWCTHIINRAKGSKADYPIKSDKDYYDAAVSRIRYSDAIFAEISNCTANMAYEISYALQNNIPVICFYKSESKLPTMIEGSTDTNQVLNIYNGEEVLEESVKKMQDNLTSKLQKNVSVPITTHVGMYLDWVSKQKKVSRSTFVRGLIESKMQKDTEYKKILHK